MDTYHPSASSYWDPVEKAIGKNGTMLPGGVFKVDLTRNDVNVSVGEVRLKPAMALDSWISFMRMGDGAMMMGDLVLLEDEMGPVQDKLSGVGIDITAIHNTLIGESPQVYDLHISGQGDPADMAIKIRDALESAGVPYACPEMGRGNEYGVDYTRLDGIIGYKGTMEGGVYHYEVPRAEIITVDGMEMPPSMDVTTIIKFQPLGGGQAAITGDFLLRPNEVKPVILALNENGIKATALHTHMLTEEPRMYMLHFWAAGEEERLAEGLHAAIGKTNSQIAGKANSL
jgi:hypothetical protein